MKLPRRKKQVNKKFNKKRFAVISALLIVSVVISGVLIQRRYALLASTQCRSLSESPIYKEATPLANESLITSADEEIAQKIEKDRGYREDINCLYPLMNYYMKTKEPEKAEMLFGLYGLAYGKDTQAEKMYRDYNVRTYEDVKKQFDEFIDNKESTDVFFY